MERCGCRRCRRGHSRVLSVARSVSTGSTRTRSSGTQQNLRLYTPRYGFFEMRAKATDDPLSMVALWMIGYEDAPDRSAEICICETFGRDVGAEEAAVGIGVHPFGDPRIVDEFAAERLPVDAREFHSYAAVWTPDQVASFVDDEHIMTVQQSPSYSMQLMLSIYEFPGEPSTAGYPKQFVVDCVRGYRPQAERRMAASGAVYLAALLGRDGCCRRQAVAGFPPSRRPSDALLPALQLRGVSQRPWTKTMGGTEASELTLGSPM